MPTMVGPRVGPSPMQLPSRQSLASIVEVDHAPVLDWRLCMVQVILPKLETMNNTVFSYLGYLLRMLRVIRFGFYAGLFRSRFPITASISGYCLHLCRTAWKIQGTTCGKGGPSATAIPDPGTTAASMATENFHVGTGGHLRRGTNYGVTDYTKVSSRSWPNRQTKIIQYEATISFSNINAYII